MGNLMQNLFAHRFPSFSKNKKPHEVPIDNRWTLRLGADSVKKGLYFSKYFKAI